MNDANKKNEIRELVDEELDEVSGGVEPWQIRGEAMIDGHATCGGRCQLSYAWYTKELPKYCPNCGGPIIEAEYS